jgi:hypothetical protein
LGPDEGERSVELFPARVWLAHSQRKPGRQHKQQCRSVKDGENEVQRAEDLIGIRMAGGGILASGRLRP